MVIVLKIIIKDNYCIKSVYKWVMFYNPVAPECKWILMIYKISLYISC